MKFSVGDVVYIKPKEYFLEYYEKFDYDFIGPEQIFQELQTLYGKPLKIVSVDDVGHISVEGSLIFWLSEDFTLEPTNELRIKCEE